MLSAMVRGGSDIGGKLERFSDKLKRIADAFDKLDDAIGDGINRETGNGAESGEPTKVDQKFTSRRVSGPKADTVYETNTNGVKTKHTLIEHPNSGSKARSFPSKKDTIK